jgi:hypothetical protein
MASENQCATARVWPFTVRVSIDPSDSGSATSSCMRAGTVQPGLPHQLSLSCAVDRRALQSGCAVLRALSRGRDSLWVGHKKRLYEIEAQNTAAVIVTCSKTSAVV